MARTRQLQDFIGFQFNGRHSSEFGLKVVSNSNRFQDNFGPTFKDNTVKVPGGDGNFYWNTKDDKKEWNLSVAFEDVSEVELREMRRWLNSKAMGELIFDEEPYKAYKVKMKSPAQFKYLCFDKEIEGAEPYTSILIHNHTLTPSQESETPAQSARNVERIYKGEGTIAFVAYQPYAESVYEDLDSYTDIDYPNKNEWKDASGILASTDSRFWHLGDIYTNTLDTVFPAWSSTSTATTDYTYTFRNTSAPRFVGGNRQVHCDQGYYVIKNTLSSTIGYFYPVESNSSSGVSQWVRSNKFLPYSTESSSISNPDLIGVSEGNTSEYRDVSNALRAVLYTNQSTWASLVKLYNPGDLETDWTLRFPRPSTSTTVTIALWSGATQPDSVVEFTTSTSASDYLAGQYIEVSSRTQLIRVLNSDFTTTSFLLNKGLSRDGFFKIPATTDPSKYSVQISGIDPSDSDVSFKYKYLYY